MSDSNKNWYVYDGSIKNLLDSIKNDKTENELKKQLENYLDLKIINLQQNFELKEIGEYT